MDDLIRATLVSDTLAVIYEDTIINHCINTTTAGHLADIQRACRLRRIQIVAVVKHPAANLPDTDTPTW